MWLVTIILVLALQHSVFAVSNAFAQKQSHKTLSKKEVTGIISYFSNLGFEQTYLEAVFQQRPIQRMEKSVQLNILNPDTKSLYKGFLSRRSIRESRRFLYRHQKELRAAQKKYLVRKEVIVAILYIETRFGKASLPFAVLDVLTTMALADSKSHTRHYQRLFNANQPDLKDPDYVTKRLKQKALFGRTELHALLKIYQNNPTQASKVYGSYAGALGIPQFLPSSYLKWGVDGNGDKQADLNNLMDAMASVGNFLKAHDWEPQRFKTQQKAVWSYNRSPHYVQAVLEIAVRLTQPRPKSFYKGRG